MADAEWTKDSELLDVDLPEIPNCDDIKISHPEIYRMFQKIYAHQLGLIPDSAFPDPYLDVNG